MLNVKFRLHNNDGTYAIDINNDGEVINLPIQNLEGTNQEDTKGVMLKAPDNSSKLKIEQGRILQNPMLSVQMLMQNNVKYIEDVNIIDTDGNPVVAIIVDDHYREARIGQEGFNFNLQSTWVSLHVIKKDQNGSAVYYLVINSSPD